MRYIFCLFFRFVVIIFFSFLVRIFCPMPYSFCCCVVVIVGVGWLGPPMIPWGCWLLLCVVLFSGMPNLGQHIYFNFDK